MSVMEYMMAAAGLVVFVLGWMSTNEMARENREFDAEMRWRER